MVPLQIRGCTGSKGEGFMEKKDKCAVCGLEFKVASPPASVAESSIDTGGQPSAKPSARVDILCPFCESPNEISWPVGMVFAVRPLK